MAPGTRAERPLVILGATASGKSALALEVAGEVDNIEIVSGDSMAIYANMDIGTASPTAAELAAVPHHLVNLIDPSEEFTVSRYKRLAIQAMSEIRTRGNTPLLVGGTGLYLRAVIDDLQIPGRYPEILAELSAQESTTALHARLQSIDPVAASRMEPTNRRRILRALEVTLGSGQPFSSFGPGLNHYPPTPFVMMALRWPPEVLDQRIATRYQEQIRAGFLTEVERLAATKMSRTAAQALGYREFLAHIAGKCTFNEALDQAIQRTRRLARRQQRWFRRDPRVIWVDAPVSVSRAAQIWDERRKTPL